MIQSLLGLKAIHGLEFLQTRVKYEALYPVAFALHQDTELPKVQLKVREALFANELQM